jgi:hypothetical protein
MSKSFEDFLKERKLSPDTLQQAARLLLAEQTDDLPEEKMRQQMAAAVGDSAAVDAALRALTQNSAALQNAAVAYLADVWNTPDGEERVRSAIEDADRSLPVIEVGILAIAAMYIAYLHYTKGIKSEETTVGLKADGSVVVTTKRDLYGPTGPLAAVGRLLSPLSGGRS